MTNLLHIIYTLLFNIVAITSLVLCIFFYILLKTLISKDFSSEGDFSFLVCYKSLFEYHVLPLLMFVVAHNLFNASASKIRADNNSQDSRD